MYDKISIFIRYSFVYNLPLIVISLLSGALDYFSYGLSLIFLTYIFFMGTKIVTRMISIKGLSSKYIIYLIITSVVYIFMINEKVVFWFNLSMLLFFTLVNILTMYLHYIRHRIDLKPVRKLINTETLRKGEYVVMDRETLKIKEVNY